MLGDGFFERAAWGLSGGDLFEGLIWLETSILAPFLLGGLLGVDFLGAVKEGCMKSLDSDTCACQVRIGKQGQGELLCLYDWLCAAGAQCRERRYA